MCRYRKKYIPVVLIIIRCWYCRWLFLHSVFYSYLRKLTPKPLLCFITGSKTSKFLPMAGSCSQTQKVGTFRLMREPVGLYPVVPTTPGFGPCEAPGLYHVTSMGVWGWWTVNLSRTGKRNNHSLNHKFLEPTTPWRSPTSAAPNQALALYWVGLWMIC